MERNRSLLASIGLSLSVCCSPAPPDDAANAASITTDDGQSVQVCPPRCEHFSVDGKDYLTPKGMADLRATSWKLLVPFTAQTSGLPSGWTPLLTVFPRSTPSTGGRGTMAPTTSTAGVARSKLDLIDTSWSLRASTPPLPVMYEATFFNAKAAKYVADHGLNVRSTTHRLERKLKREIVFPPESMALKTFWHPIRGAEKVYPRVWDWKALENEKVKDGDLPRDLFRAACVMASSANRGCLSADTSFYTVRLTDDMIKQGIFSCPRKCEGHELKKDDLMILVGLHVASKQTPEWLWATFWWRDTDREDRSGAFWTCQDANRPKEIERRGPPWTNYSMDATASFKFRKPRPQDYGQAEYPRDGRCGAPPDLDGKPDVDGEEYLATYNPFVEALFDHGLKSNCVVCHSNASTAGEATMSVPGLDSSGVLRLDDLEGHIRVDYLWSIHRLGLGGTDWPPR